MTFDVKREMLMAMFETDSWIRRVAADAVHAMFRLPSLESALIRSPAGRDGAACSVRLAPGHMSYRAPAYRSVSRDGFITDSTFPTMWIGLSIGAYAPTVRHVLMSSRMTEPSCSMSEPI